MAVQVLGLLVLLRRELLLHAGATRVFLAGAGARPSGRAWAGAGTGRRSTAGESTAARGGRLGQRQVEVAWRHCDGRAGCTSSGRFRERRRAGADGWRTGRAGSLTCGCPGVGRDRIRLRQRRASLRIVAAGAAATGGCRLPALAVAAAQAYWRGELGQRATEGVAWPLGRGQAVQRRCCCRQGCNWLAVVGCMGSIGCGLAGLYVVAAGCHRRRRRRHPITRPTATVPVDSEAMPGMTGGRMRCPKAGRGWWWFAVGKQV